MIEGVMNRSHWNRSRKSNMVSPLCEGVFFTMTPCLTTTISGHSIKTLLRGTFARHSRKVLLGHLMVGPLMVPILATTTAVPFYTAYSWAKPRNSLGKHG